MLAKDNPVGLRISSSNGVESVKKRTSLSPKQTGLHHQEYMYMYIIQPASQFTAVPRMIILRAIANCEPV